MPFQYTFRADDITTWDATTRDLIENRDRELELSLIGLNGANPIGAITMWAGSIASIPANYILCDGTSYPTSTYPELFAAINYFYGGSGANFNVPYITIPQTAIFKFAYSIISVYAAKSGCPFLIPGSFSSGSLHSKVHNVSKTVEIV